MRCFGANLALLAGLAIYGAAAEAVAQPLGLLAQAPVTESFAAWVMRTLGLFGLVMLLLGAAIFLGACTRGVAALPSGRHRVLPGLSSSAVDLGPHWGA